MNIERQIEFDKVKEMWAELAVTESAAERIRKADVCFSEDELRKQLRDTSDARELIEKIGTPPLQNISEVKDVLLIAEKGECLSPYQLERVEKVLAAVRRLKDYLERGKMLHNSLAFYEENLDPVSELREEICGKIRNGAVDDYASRELGQIRNSIIHCEEQMKQKAEQLIRAHKDCMADNYYTLRNGRICLPVKKDCKLKIAGSVIDKSATGSTLFIEPTGVSKYYEELSMLRLDEENEVYRILYTISAMGLSSAEVLMANLEMIEKLDFIFSKGKLSIDMDASEPAINTGRRIHLEDAVEEYVFQKPETSFGKRNGNRIAKHKRVKAQTGLKEKYHIGDSVMVYPDKKIGIVCEPINEKGVLRVQMPNKKIWINQKRVKLHVAATELYPEDYDFSIVFDTVENRKKRHDMERKYTEEVVYLEE